MLVRLPSEQCLDGLIQITEGQDKHVNLETLHIDDNWSQENE